ncbi:MAG: glycosyltransferase family 39 protein [Bacteroidota bacterium]|nr:glycosyltransferase family 39 protein [Bacteroidota bacterium]
MMVSNQIAGVVTVLFAVPCTTLAFYYGKKNEYNKALWLMFISALTLRIFSGTDLFLHPWDERYHALAAKSLLSHPLVPTLYDHPALGYDIKDWTGNHIWVHKPPMTLWLMALSMMVFGINEIAVRIPSILLSSIGVFLTFHIAKHFFNEKTALLASFFYAINGFLIELAAGRHPTDHVDTVFIFFIELGIFFSVYYMHRPSFRTLAFIGISTGFAVLTKWLPGFIVLAFFFVILLSKEDWKKAALHCIVAFAVAVVVFIPWQIYIYSAFPREAVWENHFNSLHIFEPLDRHTGTVFYQVAMMPRIFGELIYLPLLMLFYAYYKKRLAPDSLAIILWFVLPYLFFSFVATKMPGYVMISAPAIFIILAWAFYDIKNSIEKFRYKKLMIGFLALLVLFPVRYSFERVKPFSNVDRNPQWAQELRKLDSKVGRSKAAVFNVEHYIEAMFYANVSAYPFIPTREQIRQAKSRGFKVFIYNDVRIPAEFRTDTTVTILN